MKDELKESIYRDYFNGFSEAEIAQRTGMGRSTVNRVINKIKKTIDYRLNQLAIFEFEQYFVRFKDAIEKDVSDITKELEKTTDPDLLIRLREQRHQRRLDLWGLLGDGEMVLVLKKLKNDGITQTITKTG